jgi:hypothetical protein
MDHMPSAIEDEISHARAATSRCRYFMMGISSSDAEKNENNKLEEKESYTRLTRHTLHPLTSAGPPFNTTLSSFREGAGLLPKIRTKFQAALQKVGYGADD